MDSLTAKYGVDEEKAICVKDKIHSLLDGDVLVVPAGFNFNENFTDPTPGFYKRLYLRGDDFFVQIGENNHYTVSISLKFQQVPESQVQESS